MFFPKVKAGDFVAPLLGSPDCPSICGALGRVKKVTKVRIYADLVELPPIPAGDTSPPHPGWSKDRRGGGLFIGATPQANGSAGYLSFRDNPAGYKELASAACVLHQTHKAAEEAMHLAKHHADKIYWKTAEEIARRQAKRD